MGLSVVRPVKRTGELILPIADQDTGRTVGTVTIDGHWEPGFGGLERFRGFVQTRDGSVIYNGYAELGLSKPGELAQAMLDAAAEYVSAH